PAPLRLAAPAPLSETVHTSEITPFRNAAGKDFVICRHGLSSAAGGKTNSAICPSIPMAESGRSRIQTKKQNPQTEVCRFCQKFPSVPLVENFEDVLEG